MSLFTTEDIEKLLYNKFVVIIGDSVQRSIYKDLVLLLQSNRFLSDRQLRQKGEMSHANDQLIEGGQLGEMTNGKQYREVRQYHTPTYLLRFYFVTRCYSRYVETILADLRQEPAPDTVIMNSCLWDMTRYGARGLQQYKQNLELLFSAVKKSLPDTCLFLWNMTLPVSSSIRGGFLTQEVHFMNDTLRLDVLEANYHVRQALDKYGFDALDLHFHMRRQLDQRAADGIHWNWASHRKMSHMILSHLADAWGVGLPNRMDALFFSGNGRLGSMYNVGHNGYRTNCQNGYRTMNRATHAGHLRTASSRADSSSTLYNHEDRSRGRQQNQNHQRSMSYDPSLSRQQATTRGQHGTSTQDLNMMCLLASSLSKIQEQCNNWGKYNRCHNATAPADYNSMNGHRYQPYQSGNSRSHGNNRRR